MMDTLIDFLRDAERSGKIPSCTAYNRIDGPGSSLDLREFQESFWALPSGSPWTDPDPAAPWSAQLPRSVGITINVGVRVEAYPLPPGKIGVQSVDYGTSYTVEALAVPYSPQHWLARIAAAFNLDGVLFRLHNLVPGVRSAGLGGSATASTAICLLANRLAGNPFRGDQIVAISSLIEQDAGVSITGTQEQANAVYGGVVDYVWFPWGIPGTQSGFGTSIRFPLVPPEEYVDLEGRMSLIHSGTERASTDVNSVWRRRLGDEEGFLLHRRKLQLAYEFREGLRLRDWQRVTFSIREYRALRTRLCPEYMTAACWEIQGQCERFGAESFPLGAGGGGAVVAFCPDPAVTPRLRDTIGSVYRHIPMALLDHGHEFTNLQEGCECSSTPVQGVARP
jgi:galactokinase/mevalonate kinase-like predicted kinase